MKLPERIELPEQITVCECCETAACWLGIKPCLGVSTGSRARKSKTLTLEEALELAYESPDNWKPRRRANDAPRDLEQLRDMIAYHYGHARSLAINEFANSYGVDRDQVEAEMAKLWPIEGAA